MEEIDINKQLLQQDLFDLFKRQLQKDFEGSGLSGDFVPGLPAEYALLKEGIYSELSRVLRTNASALPGLLYRVDISELQLKKYHSENEQLAFEELLSELIIKRVLQKIILRKRFSS